MDDLEKSVKKITTFYKMKETLKKNKKMKMTGKILCGLAGFVLVFFVAWFVCNKIAERNLYGNGKEGSGDDVVNVTYLSDAELAKELWRPGRISYQGKVYEYNDEILTFLVMGIDKEGALVSTQDVAAGGQSDAIFLVILDPKNQNVDVVAVDRNLMTQIVLPGMQEDGTDAYMEAQITLQYGYGDGRESSCILTRDTVSDAMHGIPINGYVAVGYDAIPFLNDSVGGVEVTVTEDVIGDTGWTVGDKIILYGSESILYVRYRDTTVFESARLRTIRQKEYLTAFANQAMEQTKKDITLPLRLYQGVQEYIVTDLTLDEILYLAEEISAYDLNEIEIHTMSGETVQGEVYEEFYPNENELRDLLIELYYIEETEE